MLKCFNLHPVVRGLRGTRTDKNSYKSFTYHCCCTCCRSLGTYHLIHGPGLWLLVEPGNVFQVGDFLVRVQDRLLVESLRGKGNSEGKDKSVVLLKRTP